MYTQPVFTRAPNDKCKYIIDVGAGLHTVYANLLSEFRTLIIAAFEPHPDLYNKIDITKKSWPQLVSDRLTLLQQSIMDVDGVAPLYMLNHENSSSILPLNNEGVIKWHYPFGQSRFKLVKTVTTPCTTISKYVSSNRSKQLVDLLFIDVQGCQLQVLSGIDQKTFRLIKRIVIKVIATQFEIYQKQSHIVDVIDLLRDNGFKIVKVIEYSNKQERYIEFVNSKMYNKISGLHHWFNIDSNGTFSLTPD